jgi:hypothetical protein
MMLRFPINFSILANFPSTSVDIAMDWSYITAGAIYSNIVYNKMIDSHMIASTLYEEINMSVIFV